MSASAKVVGLIGLGIMGSAMSRNLRAAGYDVVGLDVAPAAMDAFRTLGGQGVGSVAEMTPRVQFILTSLPSVAALDQVIDALCAEPGSVRIVAETSTFPLNDKLRARDRLAAAGIELLDCPLSGSGVQAQVRDVVVYASGSRDAYDAMLPVFEGFSRAPHHLGPFGNGTRMKFIANLLVAIHTVAAGEAFALARRAGLDPQQVFDMVSDGAGGSRALAVRGEMLVADRYEPVRTMPLDLWRKDMRAIAEFAVDLGCPTPLFSACVPLFTAAVAGGLGTQDTAAVAVVLEAMAGLRSLPETH